ncbi:UNVERIFIED_ORG: hypothetical protein ABID57_003508 [Arthrobacter sp. UYEF1]
MKRLHGCMDLERKPVSMQNRQDRVKFVEAMMAEAINATAAQMSNRTGNITSRQLMAVTAFKLREGDVEVAEQALNIVLDHQVVNESDGQIGAYVQSIYSPGYYGRECLTFRIRPGVPTQAGDTAWGTLKLPRLRANSRISVWVHVRSEFVHRRHHYLDILIEGTVIWEGDLLDLGDGWRQISATIPANLCHSERPKASFRLRQRQGVRNHSITVILSCVEVSDGHPGHEDIVASSWEIESQAPGMEVFAATGSSFDINSTAFCLLHFSGILHSGDFNLLSKSLQERVRRSLHLALRRIIDDPVAQPGYTNARLIRDVSLILVGKWLGLTYFHEQGKKYFREWMSFTRTFGIREYGSPVYYSVDIEALYMCYQYTDDDLLGAEITAALDFFWLDIAANFFPARRSLSGSHSRDPDILDGRGSLEILFFLEGWGLQPHSYSAFDYQKVQSYANNSYYPGQQVLDLIKELPKEISARTDRDVNLDRYNYVTCRWAMGSTSNTFTNVIPGQGGPTPTDRAVNLEIGGITGPSTLSVVPNAVGTPYTSGHLPLFPSVVQHRNMLLAHLNLNPSLVRSVALNTNILIPLGVDSVCFDGQDIPLDRPITAPGSTESELFLVVADTIIGVRIIGADVVQPGPLRVSFQLDAEGLKAGVGRVEIQHYQSESAVRPRTKNAHVGIYIEIGDINSDFKRQFGSVKISSQDTDGLRTTQVTSTSGDRLELLSDTATRTTLLRSINGSNFRAPSILTVNGVDYAPALGQIS